MSASGVVPATGVPSIQRRAAWQVAATVFVFWLAETMLVALFVRVVLVGRRVFHPVGVTWLAIAMEAGVCGIGVVVWCLWAPVALLVLRLSRWATLAICASVLTVTATIWVMKAISMGLTKYSSFSNPGFALLVMLCRIVVPLGMCAVWTLALAKRGATPTEASHVET